jgi:5'-3' exonuclease
MKHLIIDGLNFFYRARSGFQGGPHPLMFNFYRSLRALVEMHKPNRVHYVLEGHPKARHEALPTYKANREILPEDPHFAEKVADMVKFHNDYNDVLELLANAFPIDVVQHADHECDDVIANLAENIGIRNPEDEIVIVSSDTDFIQLLRVPNIFLYNPVKKSFVDCPIYDYVLWKALRGDACDNIPGIPGIGDKTATTICVEHTNGNSTKLQALQRDPEKASIIARNVNLIKFHNFSDEEWRDVTTTRAICDMSRAKEIFQKYEFNSIVNDKSWAKFVSTFEQLS